ncbi:transposase, partial [Mannheimia indoligenes]|uniref:transposase n=1 Tax=Mannheimia indoligenes TaxID=3103145 RepID=UPI003D17537A
MKNCPFCQSTNIKKHGKQNNIQRHYCNQCNKTFTFQKKLNAIQIWSDYTTGKQTYPQLAEKYHCSEEVIKRFTQYPDTNVPVSYDCD